MDNFFVIFNDDIIDNDLSGEKEGGGRERGWKSEREGGKEGEKKGGAEGEREKTENRNVRRAYDKDNKECCSLCLKLT